MPALVNFAYRLGIASVSSHTLTCRAMAREGKRLVRNRVDGEWRGERQDIENV
jgi:hypothetical protein